MNSLAGASMDRRIFEMGLATEAVSAYILCCSLTDQGASVSVKNLLTIWTGSEESLRQSLDTLEAALIIEPLLSDESGGKVYHLSSQEWWHAAHKAP